MVRRFKNVAMGVGFRVGIYPYVWTRIEQKTNIAKSIFCIYIHLCAVKCIGPTNRTIQINKIILLSIIYAQYCACGSVGFLRYRLFFYTINTIHDTYTNIIRKEMFSYLSYYLSYVVCNTHMRRYYAVKNIVIIGLNLIPQRMHFK